MMQSLTMMHDGAIKLRDLNHIMDEIYEELRPETVAVLVDHLVEGLTIVPGYVKFKTLHTECMAIRGHFDVSGIALTFLCINNYNDAFLLNKKIAPDANTIFVRGLVSYHQDEMFEAVNLLKRVLEMDPEHSFAMKLLQNALSISEQKEKGTFTWLHFFHFSCHL